ncbi:unnamed protein product [Arctogadus glacialis]
MSTYFSSAGLGGPLPEHHITSPLGAGPRLQAQSRFTEPAGPVITGDGSGLRRVGEKQHRRVSNQPSRGNVRLFSSPLIPLPDPFSQSPEQEHSLVDIDVPRLPEVEIMSDWSFPLSLPSGEGEVVMNRPASLARRCGRGALRRSWGAM